MAFKNLGSKALIIIALTSIFMITLTAGLLTTSQTLSATGTISSTPPPTQPPPPPPSSTPTPIQTIGVSTYSDAALTTPITSVTWGNLSPGTQTTIAIYIKNTGNTQETLSLTTNNYTPTNANTYLNCTWNPTATTLAAGASTYATITLAASSGATTGSFNFDLTITGTG